MPTVPSPVPEPAPLALLGGMAAMAGLRRRKAA
ncbi:PEP-CTERM sorting domain-containing protein [Massilia sp. PAMC28688]|nr:PEP-CTERM sorting domain-containing protein [Massilia sp. PAMC28688]